MSQHNGVYENMPHDTYHPLPADTGFKLGIWNREKFFSDFLIEAEFYLCLYVLYIQTSSSAENREKFESEGGLFLPSCHLACSLRQEKKKNKIKVSYFLWGIREISKP